MADNSASGLQPFHAMEILARAKALEAAGTRICHLELGEPAAPPAPAVREAVRAVLDQPQRYTHAKGLPHLRESLAEEYRTRHGASVDPERMIVTMGSSAAFLLAFLAGFGPGARIAVTRPGYPAYLNILSGLDFEPVEIPLDPANNWHLTAADIETAYQSRPFEGLLFASPANPTGAAASGDELRAIHAACQRLGVRLISDEIYHGLDYRGPSTSGAEIGEDIILVNSFSKYHCMTGWRAGWLVLPPDLVRKAEILQQNLFISAPTLSQIGGLAALEQTDYAEAQKAHYAANRTLIAEGLQALGFKGAVGEGAFYAYMDVSEFTTDSMQFCLDLLDEAGVATTPGIDFDRAEGHRYVRFSYAGARADIELALERLQAWLKR